MGCLIRKSRIEVAFSTYPRSDDFAKECAMLKKTFWTVTLSAVMVCFVLQLPGTQTVYSQGPRTLTPEEKAKRTATEDELHSVAIVERKLMIPMRDGTRIATDVYRPKDRSKKYP